MLKLKILLTLFITCLVVIQDIPDQNLHIIVCDVGQGDAIIVSKGYWQLLVDGGRGSQVLECLGNELPFWDKTLEVMVATHPDADHIGGLDDVFQSYQVQRFVRTKDAKNTGDFARLIDSSSREKLTGGMEVEPVVGQNLSAVELLEVIVLSPQETNMPSKRINTKNSETMLSDKNQSPMTSNLDNSIDYNDRSIALYVTYGSVDALLMGDLEFSGEQALLESDMIEPITIIKVGHHGAKTSTSDEFLSAARPEISLISVGENNSYGHPSPLVLDKLDKVGSQIYRTDQHGTIELTTNGDWIKTQFTQ